jgi:hemerythrin-like domain-containing protein
MTRSMVAEWHAEHRHFEALLSGLQDELDLFANGERPNYALMMEILTYLTEYCDRVHHRREDVAFERLERRCPELALPLARLRQEHRVIAHAGETLRGHLASILDGALVPRAQVEVAAATYLVYYRRHIAQEESEILGRAQAALSPQDWDAVRRAAREETR